MARQARVSRGRVGRPPGNRGSGLVVRPVCMEATADRRIRVLAEKDKISLSAVCRQLITEALDAREANAK